MQQSFNSSLFDLEYLNNLNQNTKLEVHTHPLKGHAVYAIKPIKKDQILAYYQCQVYRENEHDCPLNRMYSVVVPTRTGQLSRTWIANIYPGSCPAPKRGISFYGYLANEASPGQSYNCYLDLNISENYRTRRKMKEGDVILYKLRARRDIAVGEEICWFYGEEYLRDYSIEPF